MASTAWAVTPAGTPPTFSCNPANPDKVADLLNTRGVNVTDQLNQPRWEYTGRFPSATRPVASPTLPAATWTYFTGHEMDRYYTLPDQPNRPFTQYPEKFVGFFGNPPEPANQVRYFRYKFRLAPDVDPATYQLKIDQALIDGWNTTVRQDDVLTGVYMNGALALAVNGTPSLTGTTLLGGAGGAGGLQWRAGENELVFGVYDNGGGGIWFGLQAASQATCTVLPSAAPGGVTGVPTLGAWGLGLMSALLGGLGVWRRRRSA